MNWRMGVSRVLAGGVLLLAVSAPALAQQPPEPPRPIFGARPGAFDQSLVAGLSLGQGFFRTRALGDDPAEQEFVRARSGTFGTASLDYSLSGRIAGLSANLNTTGRYFSEVTNTILAAHSAGLNAFLQASNRTRLTFGQSARYQPVFQRAFEALFGQSLDNFRSDLAVDIGESDEYLLQHGTNVGLTHQLSARSSISASYSRNRRDYSDRDGTQASDTSRVQYQRQLTSALGLRLGYAYSRNRLAGEDFDADGERPSQDHHTIDAGLDFSKALSLTRRTTLSFGTGTAITKRNDRTRAQLTGNAALTHQIGRTWSAVATYGRRVGFVEGLADAVTTDYAGVSVGGQLFPRVQVSTAASAVRGDRGREEDNLFVRYTGVAQVGISVARYLALSVGYGYQESEFSRAAFVVAPTLRRSNYAFAGLSIGPFRYLTLGLNYSYAEIERQLGAASALGRFNRHSVVATLGIAAPLFARTRSTNASR